MEFLKFLGLVYCILSTLSLLTSVLPGDTVHGYTFPSQIKIWNRHIEVSAKTLRVKPGSRVILKCDAIYSNKPYLRWYGPDKHWVNGKDRRIRVEESRSKQFLKMTILRVEAEDQGEYICRGWFGPDKGFDEKPIQIVVVSTQTTTSPLTNTPALVQKITTAPPTTRAPPTTTTTPSTSTTPSTTTESHGGSESCLPPKFQCGDGVCLDEDYVCDTFPDCVDASDELSCDSVTCLENTYACMSGDECVSLAERCDGTPHCLDGSDEATEVCQNSTVSIP